MAALIVCLVKRISTRIAISLLQASALAAVDRSASRQGPKVARYGFLVMVHTIRSRSIVTMRFREITVVDLSAAIVYISPAVLSR